MATIQKYRNAAGEARYRVRYRTPGRRQTDRRGFTTKREAEQFAATVEVSKMRGEYIAPADTLARIGELGRTWLRQQTHLKPSTARTTEMAWRVHVEPRWGIAPLAEIRHSDIQTWVAELSDQRGATTVIRAFGVLAAILDTAVRDHRLASNPARGVKLPRKVRREHTYLTHEQVHALADAAGPNGPMVLLLAYCGLRWGEAAGLRVRDCNLAQRRIAIIHNAVEVGSKVIVGTPKTHRRRTVPLPRFVIDRLAQQCAGKEPDDLLFPGPTGEYMRPSRGTGGWFENARKRAGLPRLTPHDLRHTAASLSVSAGANVKAVQKMLGHSSAAMTLDVYADLFDDDLDAVAIALDQAVTSESVGRLRADRR